MIVFKELQPSLIYFFAEMLNSLMLSLLVLLCLYCLCNKYLTKIYSYKLFYVKELICENANDNYYYLLLSIMAEITPCLYSYHRTSMCAAVDVLFYYYVMQSDFNSQCNGLFNYYLKCTNEIFKIYLYKILFTIIYTNTLLFTIKLTIILYLAYISKYLYYYYMSNGY